MGVTDLTRRTALLTAAGLGGVHLAAQAAYGQMPDLPDHAAGDPAWGARRTPFDYGADPKAEATADQRRAVQAMLDDCAASWDRPTGRFARLPDLANRTWNVGKGVSVPNLRQPGFALRNGTLFGSGEGSTVLDLAGTNSVHLQNVNVFGDRDNPPKVGILTSRTREAGGFSIAPNLEWFNVRTWGSFSGAAVVSIANEVTSFLQCSIENDSPNISAFAYMNVQNSKAVYDRIGEVRSASTLPEPGRRFSNIIHSYDQVRLLRMAQFNAAIAGISRTYPAIVTLEKPERVRWGGLKNGDEVWLFDLPGDTPLKYTAQTVADLNRAAGTFALKGYDNREGPAIRRGSVQNRTGPAMLFSGAHDVHISNGYGLTYGNHAAVFDLVNGSPPRSFRMHLQCEHSPHAPILIEHGDEPKVWQGAEIHLPNNSQTNTSCIIDDRGEGIVALHDVKLKVNNMGRPPADKVFRNPGRFALRDCEITVPRADALNDPADFESNGAVFEAYDRRDARHDWRHTETYRLRHQGAPVATVVAATADELKDPSSAVNARYKQTGKMVFDTSAGRPVYATGASPSSPWNDAMGQAAYRPR